MTDEDVVRRYARTIGLGRVTEPRQRPDRKKQWQWRAFGAAAMAHLDETIGPYLGERRRAKLDEMLTFQPKRDGERGQWIGTRWFADPNRVVLTNEEIRHLLLLGYPYSRIAASATRVSRIRKSIRPALLRRAAELR